MYEQFEKLCKKNKVSAYRVSKDTGIPQTAFSDWRHGRSTPKLNKLVKLAEYFDVPLEYFVKKMK